MFLHCSALLGRTAIVLTSPALAPLPASLTQLRCPFVIERSDPSCSCAVRSRAGDCAPLRCKNYSAIPLHQAPAGTCDTMLPLKASHAPA